MGRFVLFRSVLALHAGAVFLFFLFAPVAQGQPAVSGGAKKGGEAPVTLSADRIIHQGGRTVTQADGAVEVTYGGKTITGDKGLLNHETGDGFIEGNVHFTDPKSDITGDSMDFNTVENTGTLYNGRGRFGDEFFFTGEKIERKSDERYVIKDGTCSSCPFEKQSWRFDAKSVDVTVEDYAYIKGLKMRAGGVPVMYLPYMVVPVKTKRATGFLTPVISHSSENGMMYSEGFFWAINDSQDATVSYESLGSHGSQYNLEYRYILSKHTSGRLDAKYLRETDPDKPNDRDLWKIKYDHAQALPFGISNVIHVDRESEQSIARQYGDDVNERTRRYTDSYATFKKVWPTRNVYFNARMRQSTLPDYVDEVNTLPNLIFTNQAQKLWKAPVYGALQSSLVSYRTRTQRGDRADRFDVDRFDFRPDFSAPVAVAPWLNITPKLGLRYSWYSRGGDEDVGSFSREYYTAGVGLTGPKFFRIFDLDSKKKPKAKHLIVPSVSWDYVPDYDVDGEDRLKPRVLDGLDRSAPGNIVRYQLSNQLLMKEMLGAVSSRTIEVVKLNVSQSYNILEAQREENPEREKRPFSTVLVDLDTRPFSWLMLNYDTRYNIYDAIWETSNLEIGFRYRNLFHFALDRSFKHPDIAWDTAYVEINLPWRVSLDYSIIYNEKDQETQDSLLRMIYDAGCWGLTLSWYDRKINVTDASGQSQLERETKFLFMLTLKGLGDVFGETRSRFAQRKI